MQLHADQGYVLPPWPATPLACSVAWVPDDFTEDNGGTRYVPGSHTRGHGPEPGVRYATTRGAGHPPAPRALPLPVQDAAH